MNSEFSLPDGIYLLSHSVGCLPEHAEQTLNDRYLKPWQTQGGDAWPGWLSIIDDFCAQLALLIGAEPQEICPQSNVSSGLTKYLMSLPMHKDKNVILMHASAFPSMGFVAQALTRCGYVFALIDEQHCPRDLNVWQQHLSENTAAVVISHVHSNSGVLSPVADISQMARQYGAKAIVDIAQSVGVVPVEVKQWRADCVIGSCVKWLCGGPGAGFMWLDTSQLEQLKPLDVGWFSHANPFEFDIRHFDYATNAKRFWGGTPNIASYATALGSLEVIKHYGVENIAAHNLALREKVYAAARPWLRKQHCLTEEGGSLCLHISPAVLPSCVAAFKTHQVFYDQRGEVLRLSWHIYNTESQAAQIADIFSALA